MAIFPKGSKSRAVPNFSLDLSSHLPSISRRNSPEAVDKPPGSRKNKGPSALTDMHPLKSPSFEDVPLWNILPSYELYLSTFSKSVNPLSEDYVAEPPTYEEPSPVLSELDNEYTDYFGQRPSSSGSQNAVAITRWENTIAANTHRLKRLATLNKSLADSLKIQIVLTRSPGMKDRPPVIYDSLLIEYTQGDSIHGFVTVCNTHSEPITFDVFSVIFEGRIAVNSNEGESGLKPIVFYKFLNMFDFSASWTPANFEAQSSDLLEMIDSIDGSNLFFPRERYLVPGMVYKKFFNFTIPEKLLDSACEVHDVPAHCNLIPSIGLDKDVFLLRLRQMRLTPKKPEKASFSMAPTPSTKGPPIQPPKKPAANVIVKDFCFLDTSISYSVEARMIGKLSSYGKGMAVSTDEFIMLKEASSPLRIVPRPQEDESNSESVARKHYEAFRRTIEKTIDLGRRLDEGRADAKLPQRRSSVVKQTYQNGTASAFTKPQDPETYEVHLPYKKKTLTQPVKVAGMVKATFSRREHVAEYIMPFSYKPLVPGAPKGAPNALNQIRVPVSLQFKSSEAKGCRPPEIKSVTGKLMICTVRTKKYPIPLQLTQDMKFQNSLAHNDSIDRYVSAPFSKYLSELTKYIGKYGHEVMNVNQQTIMDVKSLAHLELKTNSLKLDSLVVKTASGLAHWQESNGDWGEFLKQLDLQFDFRSLYPKDSKSLSDEMRTALSLVPSFESCLMCRYYYIHIDIKLYNGDTLPIRVPLVLR